MSKKTNPKAPAKARRTDGILSPEELAKAIEEYKARRAAAQADSEEQPAAEPVAAPAVEDGEDTTPVEEPTTTEEQVQLVKDRRDRRDEGEPEDMEAAKAVIAQQDGDMNILFDIIDTLLAQGDFQKADAEGEETPAEEAPAAVTEDEDDEPVIGASVENADDEDDDIPNTNTSEVGESVLNVDSVDAIVRQRIQLGMVGRKLNMDGLENMSISTAKKAIIRAVRPALNLDGKSTAYINAAYDCAVADVNARSEKGIDYQKNQMFNKDSRTVESDAQSSAAARQRMIDRQHNKKEDK